MSNSGGTVATYTYDPAGRRVKKVALGTTTRYYYSQAAQVLEERVGTAGHTDHADREYIWGLRYVDDLILCDYAGSSGSSSSSSGGSEPSERHYALQDALFNVVALADPVIGEAIERYAYHPYGRVTILDGDTLTERPTSLFDNPYTFTGRRLDPETGLDYYRARYYHPTLGRFLSRDPLGYVDGPGLYAYVNAGPLGKVDPSGNACACGPDITESLQDGFWRLYQIMDFRVRLGFSKADFVKRCNQAWSSGGWDIIPLAGKRVSSSVCPKGKGCVQTATLAGRCVRQHEANYLLWGVGNALCRELFAVIHEGGIHNLYARNVPTGVAVTAHNAYEYGHFGFNKKLFVSWGSSIVRSAFQKRGWKYVGWGYYEKIYPQLIRSDFELTEANRPSFLFEDPWVASCPPCSSRQIGSMAWTFGGWNHTQAYQLPVPPGPTIG